MKATKDLSKRFWVMSSANKLIATYSSKAGAQNKWYDIASANAATGAYVWDNLKKTRC